MTPTYESPGTDSDDAPDAALDSTPVLSVKLRKQRGPITRFPGKLRTPFALGLPKDLHKKLQQTADRLGLKRGDTICELLTQYADDLKIQKIQK